MLLIVELLTPLAWVAKENKKKTKKTHFFFHQPAVIPAPIAYIKVAAVKELVVGSEARNFLIAFGLCSERGIALMLYGGLIFQFPHLLFS